MQRLSSAVAHDFNNLLTIILGNLDFIRESLPESSDLIDILTLAIMLPNAARS